MPIEPIRILSVEDDDFMKMFIRDVFWLHGPKHNFKLSIADNIEAARKIVTDPQTRPHLIFLDIALPQRLSGSVDQIAGFRFLEELRKNPATKDIKVVVYSAHSDKEMQARALKLGADRFLVKGDQIPTELIKTAVEILNIKTKKAHSIL